MTDAGIDETASGTGPRTKIWALHSTRPMLGTGAGDLINEARFLASLSQFADVYYNGTLFQPGAPDYGLNAGEIVVPKEGYDLYYVNSNPDLFAQLPHPKIAMGNPHTESVFETADALLVPTESWRKGLLPYDPETSGYSARMTDWYGDAALPLKRVINVGESIDPHFRKEPNSKDVLEARMRLGLFKTIGYFGSVRENTFPQIFLEAYKATMKEVPDVKFAVSGSANMSLDRTILRLPWLPYEKMPALIDACIATVADEGQGSMFLGSAKVLDSMARGVPVIAYKSLARIEQLGDDYPLYYEDVDSCRRCIRKVILEADVQNDVTAKLLKRIGKFTCKARSERIRPQLMELIAPAKC